MIDKIFSTNLLEYLRVITMAKEKKMHIEKEQKDMTFYYEIIGIITIIISLLGFARLGIVGYYIMLLFKITFGDWYFLFLFMLLLYGVRALIVHKAINIKTMRIIGIFLILIAVVTISHFSMHRYIKQFGTSYFKMTFSLYLDYFKNYKEGMVVGGGVVGTLLFYLGYKTLGVAGIILIVVCLLFVGSAFVCEKTIKEFVIMFGTFFKKTFFKFTKLFKSLKYDIKKSTKEVKILNEEEPTKSKTKAKKGIISSFFNICSTNHKVFNIDELPIHPDNTYSVNEKQHAESIKKTICAVLNTMNIFYNDVSYEISNHVTVYTINTIMSFSMDALQMKLHTLITDKFLIKKDLNSSYVKIEVANLYQHSVGIKKILNEIKNKEECKILPLGINTYNELVPFKVTNAICVMGSTNNNNAKLLLNALVMAPYYMTSPKNFETYIYDLNGHMTSFEKMPSYFKNVDNLVEVIKDVDERYQTFQKVGCSSLFEYNMYIKKQPSPENQKKYKQIYVIIMGLEEITEPNELDHLAYLLQVSSKCGYTIISCLSKDVLIPSHLNSLFNVKVYLKGCNKMLTKYVGYDNTSKISIDEGFVVEKDITERFSMVEANIDDVNVFLKHF